jgi:hypothetical protein
MEITDFIKEVPNFDELAASDKIEYLAYFLIIRQKSEGFKPKEIAHCFDILNLQKYTNISAYLSKHSKVGAKQKFLKKKEVYLLEGRIQKKIAASLNNEQANEPANNLYPLSIFDCTRGYLIAFAREAANCYDSRLYNSCFFMIRKMTEVLIIDIYEKHQIEDKIKNSNGNYLMLSELLNKLTSEKTWTLSKLAKQEIPKIKKMADSSVHNKLFSAKKQDIDNIKTDLRIILQELINMVDYSNWK